MRLWMRSTQPNGRILPMYKSKSLCLYMWKILQYDIISKLQNPQLFLQIWFFAGESVMHLVPFQISASTWSQNWHSQHTLVSHLYQACQSGADVLDDPEHLKTAWMHNWSTQVASSLLAQKALGNWAASVSKSGTLSSMHVHFRIWKTIVWSLCRLPDN